MAFSFNPGQSAGGAVPQAPAPSPSPSQASSIVPPAGTQASPDNSIPTVPDSPFLFMQHRDQPVTVNAYLQILLMVVCFLSILASVILFSYGMYLKSSIDSKKAELALREESFKEYPFAEMKKASNRFALLNKILNDYVSARSPLKYLEDVVEKQAVFSDFNLNRNKSGSGFTMAFNIKTNNYKAMIQQLGALGLAQYSKIVPDPKPGNLVDGLSLIKIGITTPVFVQGMIPENIVFTKPVTGSGVGTTTSTGAQTPPTPQNASTSNVSTTNQN
jgi:Tfp pilus assembly protein PilE